MDRREPVKRDRAIEVLRRVAGAGCAALPAQVLSEFANACLRKLAFPVLPLTGPVVLEALRVFGSTCSHTTTPKSGPSPAWGRWPWS